MDGWMYGWIDGWMNEWMDLWMNGGMDGWVDGWKSRRMVEWVGGWMNGGMGGWMDGSRTAIIEAIVSSGRRRENIQITECFVTNLIRTQMITLTLSNLETLDNRMPVNFRKG